MKKREWLSIIILAMVTAVTVLIGIGQIYVSGIDGARLVRVESLLLLLETGILFLSYFLIFHRTRTVRLRAALSLLVAGVFCWLHRAFLPVLVSGFYVLVLIKLGSVFRSFLDRKGQFVEYHAMTAMADFVLGCGLMILLFCLMSLTGIGGIVYTRIAAVLLAVVLALPVFVDSSVKLYMRPRMIKRLGRVNRPVSWTASVLLSIVLALLLLQVGRMNVCLDYDSLHYGLRSEFVLNNRNGIYENLGSVNVVYTYSKGLEILLLPLSGLPSYGFFLGFQMWVTAGLLAVAGKIAESFTSRRYGLLCMALLASIPGIMNMGITAKTDSMTVLMQLIMVYFLIFYLKKRRSCYMTIALCAFMMTMVLKPTALVFSTVLLATAAGYMIATRQLRFTFRGSLWPAWIPMAAMWGLVWLRTLLLTGIPVTSVFSSLWEELGFDVKYPFLFAELPSNGGSVISRSGILHFLRRLYGVLLAPVGEDMEHVRIAWGTGLILIFLTLFLIAFLVEKEKFKKRERQPFACLAAIFLTNSLASLAALYLLWQVDGNYFLLLYALFGILAVIAVGKMKSVTLSHLIAEMLMPVIIFNVTVTAVSNWAGKLGMTPIKVFHAGYYDHQAENRERMERYGNKEIWRILAEDPTTRVLIFGDQPEMLVFLCNAQSYTDIEGSDGNVYLSASPEALVCYLEYAGTEYIYLGAGYLKPGTDGWRNVISMLEDGYLTDIFYEAGNALGRFEPYPSPPENPEEIIHEFAMKYWAGEQR